ncbi:MAG: GNAT family N-acetyltransferase [Desulfobulbaceae bacterium]|nr:MAG: GNAT family N-acetyltransferase [Desulfobulbaceae bacterium]
MNKMNISELQKQELDSLGRLYQQLIPNKISLDKMTDVFDRNRNNENHICLVAREQGVVIGTLMAYICEMYFGQCKSFMVIEDLVVDEFYRGRGVGSKLVQAAEQRAQTHNCSYIMLITDREREESQNFYKKLGYATGEYCAFKKKV